MSWENPSRGRRLLALVKQTTSVTINSTNNEPSPTVVVQTGTIVLAAGQQVRIRYFCPTSTHSQTVTTSILIRRSADGGATWVDLGHVADVLEPGVLGTRCLFPLKGECVDTPGAGSFNYQVAGYCTDVANFPVLYGGAGGFGLRVPATLVVEAA